MNSRTVYGGHTKFWFKGPTIRLCATDNLSMFAIGVTHIVFCSPESESHQAGVQSVDTSPQSELPPRLVQGHH
jgi:hypothetical protein